ncbi:MAG: outer membrane protein assembly factor BamA [Rickettsiales bacterium]|jgi:outer membrane protein insertion porin family|nr:outer membrane protein assembly factor BamA [Rickettsiales bacterium]
MKSRYLPLILLCVSAFPGRGWCSGRPKSSNIIRAINIAGNRHYNASYYLEVAEVDVGDRFSRELGNGLEKRLIDTGLLDRVDSSYDATSGTLRIDLDEKPLITRVNFVGAGEFEKDDAMESIHLKSGEVFSDKFLLEDKNLINIFYKSQGYFGVKVDYDLKRLEGNFVEITVNVSRGEKARIGKIHFVGNRAFSDDALRDEIFSRENRFYRFGKSINYDPNVLDYDRYLLEKFYRSQGYFNAKITSAVGIYNPEKNDFAIVYSLEENRRYFIGRVTIDDQVGKVARDTLEEKIKPLESGNFLDLDLVNDVTRKLNTVFADMGYLTVAVSPDFSETDGDRIDMVFRITYDKAKMARYVGKIEVYGNSRTRDQVIRGAMDIREGSQYNEFLLERTLQKVRNLGFFSEVVHEEVDGAFDNQSDIILGVTETSTGSVVFGIAYSTLDHMNGSVGFEQRNLFGRAINLSLDLRKSKYSSNLGLSFSKPNVFGTKARGGFGFLFSNEENSKNPSFKLSYDEYIAGFNGFLKFNITDYLSQRVAYRFDYRKMTYLEWKNDHIYPNGSRLASEVSTNLSYDRLDSSFNPRSGYLLELDLAAAGLGGDKKYLRAVGHFTYYYPIYLDKLIFKFGTRLGYLRSLDRNNLLYPIDGFYLGGRAMRGFEYGGVGPRLFSRDGKFSNGLGGTNLLYFNGEVIFPIYLHRMLGVYGIFFANTGTTTGVERGKEGNSFEIRDSGTFRAAAGFSLLFRIARAIDLSLDFSRTLKKESYDRDEGFRIDIGAGARL